MNQAAHQGPDKNHLPTDRAVQAPHPYLGKREDDTSSTSTSGNMIEPPSQSQCYHEVEAKQLLVPKLAADQEEEVP